MLEVLNNIFSGECERLLCVSTNSEESVSLQQFQKDLSNMRYLISQKEGRCWLLYSENTYHFLIGFMALLGMKKQVVICASDKSDWVDQFSDRFDAVLTDGRLEVEEKELIDFSFLADSTERDSAVEDWYPKYTGKESIMFFTSGSTGKPKSIDKVLLALLNEIATLDKTFKAKLEGATYLASVSHLHIYGLLFKLLLPLLTKGSWLNQQVEYPEQLGPIVRGIEKPVFISSPAFLSRLDLKLPSVNMAEVFSSGGPLAFTAANEAERYFGNLPIEVYGSTETGGIAYRQQACATTAWTPFPGITFETNSEGIRLFSPNVLEASGVILDDNLEFSADGNFVLKGRKDRVLKIEEKRISLTEIEQYLEAFDDIERSVALIVSGSRDVIGCVIVLSESGKQNAQDQSFGSLVKSWKNKMRTRFELVTIPKKWRQLDEIPLNSQSKIDIQSLLVNFKS